MIQSFIKDPDSVLDYTIDWTEWLGNDTIATSVWTLSTGITQSKPATNTATTATVWLSGGSEGSSYMATNRITTAGGRTDDRTIEIVVSPR